MCVCVCVFCWFLCITRVLSESCCITKLGFCLLCHEHQTCQLHLTLWVCWIDSHVSSVVNFSLQIRSDRCLWSPMLENRRWCISVWTDLMRRVTYSSPVHLTFGVWVMWHVLLTPLLFWIAAEFDCSSKTTGGMLAELLPYRSALKALCSYR